MKLKVTLRTLSHAKMDPSDRDDIMKDVPTLVHAKSWSDFVQHENRFDLKKNTYPVILQLFTFMAMVGRD